MKTGSRTSDVGRRWLYFLALLTVAVVALVAGYRGLALCPGVPMSIATVLSVTFSLMVGTVARVWTVGSTRSVKVAPTDTVDGELLNLFRTALDKKHSETRLHSDRVSVYLVWFAEQVLGGLSDEERCELAVAGMLHDVGKIRVPTRLLASSGHLSAHDVATIRLHPEYGVQIIGGIPAFQAATTVVLYHHERYDGTGYPCQLRGQEIPLYARMAAVVDTFDAMTGKRAYRRPLSPEAALQEIITHSGSQFDPVLVERFVQEFHQIRKLCHALLSDQSGETWLPDRTAT